MTITDILRIPDLDSLELNEVQKGVLITNVYNLISAHTTGESQFLRRVMLPRGNERITWTSYAAHRLPIILRSGGLQPNDITNAMRNPTWEVLERAWNIMVAEYKLTNWWSAISWEQSQAWVHRTASQNSPPGFTTGIYGDFAGTVIGPSLIRFESGSGGSETNPETIAAVRLVLRFYGREKPIIYVFRWKWNEEQAAWYPLDRCIGVVGRRAPDPFF